MEKKYIYLLTAVIAVVVLVGVINPFEFYNDLVLENNPTTNWNAPISASSQGVGQAFQPPNPGMANTISRVGVLMSKTGSFTGSIKVQLWKDDGQSPIGPDTLVKEAYIIAGLVPSSQGWVYSQLNYTYTTLTYGFIILDFSGVIGFTGTSHFNVYGRNDNPYGGTSFCVWAGENGIYFPMTSYDLNFRVYHGKVKCWRCSGTTPQSNTFPLGTICGQGDAASWPYSTEPNCQNLPPVSATPTGPVSGTTGTPYTYVAQGSDPEGDTLQYQLDVYIGTSHDYYNYQSSPSFEVTFGNTGTYGVRCKLKDVWGAESSWSPGLVVSITGGGGTGTLDVYTRTDTNAVLPLATIALTPGTQTAASDNDGYYQFTGLTEPSYMVTVTKTGYQPWSTVSPVAIPGQVTSANALVGSSITYTVLVSDGTVPISGAEVTLDDGDNELVDNTDDDGKVIFPGIETGSYQLIVSLEGYLIHSETVSIQKTETKTVTLSKGFDWFSLIINLIICIIVLVIFLVIARFLSPPLRYIILVVGILITVLLFFLFWYMNIFVGLLE